MEELWSILQAVLSLAGASGLVSTLIVRRIDRLERKLDARENDRVEENVVRGEVLSTVGRLSEANTRALDRLSGEPCCPSELAAHREAVSRLERFVRSKSAKYLHAN